MSYSKNTIHSTVIKCNYDRNFYNHITTNINTINEQKFNNFFIQSIEFEGSIIIQIFLEINIVYDNTQKFSIPLSILITRKFPYEPPIFSVILKYNNTIYNHQNHDIEQNTGKLLVKSLINWDYSLSLLDVLKDISSSFHNVFPILQAPPGHVNKNAHNQWNNNTNSNHGHSQNQNQNQNQINNEYLKRNFSNCIFLINIYE